MTRRPISRRDHLLAVAAEQFAARGFGDVTVDELGEAAGVSGPAIYHHFAGKEAMLGEVLVALGERLVAGAHGVTRRDGAVIEGLVRAHCELAIDEPALVMIRGRDLAHAGARERRRIRRLVIDHEEIWVAAILADRPGTDRATALCAARAVLALIESAPRAGALGRDETIELVAVMARGALAALD